MAMTLKDLRDRREAILAISERYGARELRVFGSVVPDEADAASDVDFLVESWSPVAACSISGACSWTCRSSCTARSTR
jgi:predicted nucleotidyltransferase